MVHHALCNLIEPRFERLFISDSYANRKAKGTHRAVDRLQSFARRYRYVLRADIVQHFASVDHAILMDILRRRIPEPDIMGLVETIVDSGRGVLDEEYRTVRFPGDDLLAICRPRGLPIGNLTSQFWSNCYLHPFDEFVTRELGCRAYLRYVDDFALFGDSKRELWAWKAAIIDRLAHLRLVIHETRAQVLPVGAGIPWLGFVDLSDAPTGQGPQGALGSPPAPVAARCLSRRRDQLCRARCQHPGLDQPRRPCRQLGPAAPCSGYAADSSRRASPGDRGAAEPGRSRWVQRLDSVLRTNATAARRAACAAFAARQGSVPEDGDEHTTRKPMSLTRLLGSSLRR